MSICLNRIVNEKTKVLIGLDPSLYLSSLAYLMAKEIRENKEVLNISVDDYPLILSGSFDSSLLFNNYSIFSNLCSELSKITLVSHNSFYTDKGRKVQSLKKEYSFMIKYHKAFSFFHEKILFKDLLPKVAQSKYCSFSSLKSGYAFEVSSLQSSVLNNCFLGIFHNVDSFVDQTKDILTSNKKGVIKCDITSFFSSITKEKIVKGKLSDKAINYFIGEYSNRLKGIVSTEIDYSKIEKFKKYYRDFLVSTLINDKLPMGTSYSSVVASFLFSPVDNYIRSKLSVLTNKNYKYYRYIDDMIFLVDDIFVNMKTVKEIEKAVNKFGFFLKYKKTQFYKAKEPKSILGLVWIDGKITPASKTFRKLKTAIYNNKDQKVLNGYLGYFSNYDTLGSSRDLFCSHLLKEKSFKPKKAKKVSVLI